MEPLDLKHKYLKSNAGAKPSARRRLPFAHIFIAGALFAVLGVFLLPSEQASASRQTQVLALPILSEDNLDDLTVAADLAQAGSEQPAAGAQAHTSKLSASAKRIEERVASGDSLSALFHRAGLTDGAMFELINSSQEAKGLSRLFPGHSFLFDIDQDGRLVRLEHVINRLTSQVFTRSSAGFDHSEIKLTPDVKYAVRSGTITSSLYNAGIEAHLDDQLIMEMASIFGWDVDFALDIRVGDRFKILFEESFLEGERLGSGSILAAEFVNQGTLFKAVRYVDGNGRAQYYTPDGKAMQKAFLRAPLDFRRISSNFNPKRLHPISKTVRPHRGTDYAANRGTPVWAAGDGRVAASGYTKANGNYVVIQHGGDIQTKYLHLHKRLVKTGDRVRQKQNIGTVGSTGYSTAPHLHYEFLLNGVHRNPRTIVQKLPKAESIAKDELPRFFAQTQPLLAELEQTTRFALAEKSSDTNL